VNAERKLRGVFSGDDFSLALVGQGEVRSGCLSAQ
jgi:hypothetical protein